MYFLYFYFHGWSPEANSLQELGGLYCDIYNLYLISDPRALRQINSAPFGVNNPSLWSNSWQADGALSSEDFILNCLRKFN